MEARHTGRGVTRILPRLVVWAAGSAVGATLIALPDSDARVFSLSQTHGPSTVDLIGIVIVVLVWVPVPALIWSHRDVLRGGPAWLLASLVFVGVVALAVAIRYDLGALWLAPATLLLAVQLVALGLIGRRPRT